MSKWIIIAMLLALLAGCQNGTEQFQNDWYAARAKVLYGVAREHFQAGQLDQTQDKCLESMRLDTAYAPPRLLLGKVCIEKGLYGAAIRQLEELKELTPNSAELYYLLGCAQEKHDQAEQAITSFRKAYALGDKSDMTPITAATEALASLGRIREAQLYVESYLGESGNDATMFELAGRLAMMQSQYGKAARFYEQAHDLHYRNVRYAEAMSKARFFAGRYADAMDGFRGLTERDDYEAPMWVHAMLGDSYLALGRLNEARDSYQAAIELQPDHAGTWLNQAKAELALGDATRAILSARRCLQLDPRRLEAALVLGYALIRDGQAEQAVWLLNQFVPDHSKDVNLRCLLGRAYAAVGNDDDALRCYRAALAAEPANPLAKELLAAAGQRSM